MAKNSKIIGIDLGSYNSCVSVYEGGELKIIPNSEGKSTTPSYVFIDGGEIKVGDPAKRQATLNPENVIFNIKRLMGKTYESVKHLKRPYKIVKNKNGGAAVKIGDRIYSPEEISAMILQKMKKTAVDFLGEEVTRCIITVPAHFDADERQATKHAGEIAGFTVERVIAEPTAAILNISDSKSKIYAVYDFGGQTFDVSIVDVGDNVYETKATNGDLELGGSGIDEELINWLAEEFQKEHGVDPRKDELALQRLFEAAENAKIELSSSVEVDINLPYLLPVNNVPKHLVRKLNRSKFNQFAAKFVNKTIELTKKSLEMANLKVSDIDEIILVGGSTRIPLVQEELEKFFGKKPNKSLNPDTCVSTGATIQGGVLTGEVKDILLLDVIPLSLGIETAGGVFTKMVDANTTIPVSKSEIFSTASDNQPSVQIHVLQGERPMAKDNKSIGNFEVQNLLPAPRGVPQIEVTFNVDADGILTVTARDKNTGKESSIKIQNSSALSDEEVKRMREDAEMNAESDRIAKEGIEKINAAESLLFGMEKTLSDTPNFPEDGKTELEGIITELKEAISKKEYDNVDALTAKLQQRSGEIYQQMSESTQQGEPVNESSDNSSAETVNYEEVDKK